MTTLAEILEGLGAPTTDDDATMTIADAALRQFELCGITRSTMEQIARRAGVSRVTLYRRFPGKQALVTAVILRELASFTAELDRAVEPFDDPDDRLVEGFIYVLEAMRTHRLLQRVLESEPETILPTLTVEGAPFVALARGYLAERLLGDLDDGRSREDAELTADIVVRLLLSYLLTPQTLIDLDDPAAARTFALRYLAPVLAGPDAATGGP